MTIFASDARKAFWTALRDLQSSPGLSPAQIPEFDEQDGPGGRIDGQLPEGFYALLAGRINQLSYDEPPKNSGIDVD